MKLTLGRARALGPKSTAVAAAPLGMAALLALLGWLLLGDVGIAMRERAALPTALELLRRHAASDTTVPIARPRSTSTMAICLMGPATKTNVPSAPSF